MDNKKPKLGNINAFNEFRKKIAESRNLPLPKSIFDIVQENYDRNNNWVVDDKPRIGKKCAGRRIAKKLAEIRNQPLSGKLLKIVAEISADQKKRKSKSKK